MLIEGNEPDVDEDGVLIVGAEVGAAVGAGAGAGAGAVGAAPPKGDGVGAGAVGEATCAPAFMEEASKTMPATAPLRARLVIEAIFGELRIIAGDP